MTHDVTDKTIALRGGGWGSDFQEKSVTYYQRAIPVKRVDFDGRGDFDGLIKQIFSTSNLCSQLLQLSFIYPSVSI